MSDETPSTPEAPVAVATGQLSGSPVSWNFDAGSWDRNSTAT